MVDADGQNGLVADNDLTGAMKRVVFGAFNVHLDHGDGFNDREIIEGITLNFDASVIALVHHYSSATIGTKPDDAPCAAGRAIYGMNSVCDVARKVCDIVAQLFKRDRIAFNVVNGRERRPATIKELTHGVAIVGPAIKDALVGTRRE